MTVTSRNGDDDDDDDVSSVHRKLYVSLSVALCLLVISVVLYFLFPRLVVLSPVGVYSSFVYFTDGSILIDITVSKEGGLKDGMDVRWTYNVLIVVAVAMPITNQSSFPAECPEHHQSELCGGSGLQPLSAGCQLRHGGGDGLHSECLHRQTTVH